MPRRRLSLAVLGQALRKGAVGHAGRLDNEIVHDFGEGSMTDVFDERLDDLVGAAGIEVA